MFHSSMPENEQLAFRRTDLYPIAMAMTAAYPQLCVTQCRTGQSVNEAVLAFPNGLPIAHIKGTSSKYRVAFVDSFLANPFEHSNQTELVETANSRYAITAMTSRNKAAATRFRGILTDKAIKLDLTSYTYEFLSRITSSEKAAEPLPASLTSNDIYELSRIVNNRVDKLDIDVSLLSKIDGFTAKYDEYCLKRDSYNSNMSSMFKGEKWLIAAVKTIDHECNYHVMAIDSAPLLDPLTGVGSLHSAAWRTTLPLQTYRSLNHLPDGIRDDLLGAMTMLKLYRRANYSHFQNYEIDGYISAYPYVFDANIGWAQTKANRHLDCSGYIMMLDK